MGSVHSGEITVAYEDEGSGEPLVLIHGHPFNRSMWRPQIDHFSRAGWRVITPDLRGYGDSTVVPGKTPLETYVRDIAGLLDHLGIERFVLGGLSMGGQIVMEFHRLLPDRIRAVVLADTFAPADTDEGRAVRHRTAARLLRDGMDGYAREVLPKMISPGTIARQPAVAEHVLGMMRSTSPEGAAAALYGRAERPDYTGLLPRIAVPAWVVVGAEDAFTPVADARLIQESIPGASLTVVQDAGHMPNLEHPDVFNAGLARFLESLHETAS
ncbi:alpha/beta hydrolase [Streptomyces albospinus]|uniref:Alpha/beta hydrolase n=1 Tax=Streptomyces albospinus TaxID=285515 RepID=A0ABQ2VEP1_9ACTN|nr:alpha/beta fold hydrolase [Streptomyces albospinus]GGU80002.1 alpha/beta hydrolase [Streptomyces albospinus]